MAFGIVYVYVCLSIAVGIYQRRAQSPTESRELPFDAGWWESPQVSLSVWSHSLSYLGTINCNSTSSGTCVSHKLRHGQRVDIIIK